MAIDETMDDEEVVEKKPKQKSNLLLILLLVMTTLLLLAVSVVATLYFTGAFNQQQIVENTLEGNDKGGQKGDKKNRKETSPPTYVQLGDPMVVNFVVDNQIRYLQVQMEVMTRKAEMADKIKTHMPLIRNNLLLMLSDLDYATISSFSGKQKIRAEALAEVQSIMKEQEGDPAVEELYFTTFVMQ